jgi:hypothetical protein
MSDPTDTAERRSPLISPRPGEKAPAGDGRQRRWIDWILRLGPLVLLAVSLLPARWAALRGDDEWNFDMHGLLLLEHQSLWHEIWTTTKYTVDHGRPEFLGAIVSDPVLVWFDGHTTEYHLFIVATTVLCGALLWSLVRELSGSPRLAATVVVVFAAVLQFHFYHDALLGYYGGTQFALALILGSLVTFMRALRAERRAWHWALASVVLFAAACSIEQWAPTLMLTHVCLALVETRDPRRLLRLAGPLVVVGAAYLVAGAAGAPNQGAAAASTGYRVSSSISEFIKALVISWAPPLPTSNRLFSQGPIAYFYGNGNPYPLGGSLTPAEWLGATWRGLVTCACVFGYVLWPGELRPGWPSVPRGTMRLLAAGLPLWLVTPALVDISAKYQVADSLTRGYLESLVQVVGVVLVIGGLLLWLREVTARRGPRLMLVFGGVASVALGFAGAVDGFNNIRVIALEQDVRHTRDLLGVAIHDGVLAAVPQRSTLLLSGADMDWPTGQWAIVPGAATLVLYADTHRLYDVRPDADQTPINCARGTLFPPPACAPPGRSSYWVRIRATFTGGDVIVARIAPPTAQSFLTAPAESLTVYTQGSGSSVPAPPSLVGTTAGGSPWTSASLHFQRERAGRGWAIYTATVPRSAAPVAAGLTDPASPVDFEAAPPPPDQLAREFGTKQLLP